VVEGAVHTPYVPSTRSKESAISTPARTAPTETALTRPFRALARLPDAKGWAQSVLISAAATAAIALVAAASNLLTLSPRLTPAILTAFLIPAFTEELLFRGFVTTRRAVIVSTGLFTLWHVVEALTFLPGAALFLTPGFLIGAAILGLGAGLMRLLTGSLWPPVLFHGTIVALWQSLFGGPDLAVLLVRS
jgi:predicted Abi (CAAX) family protease